MGPRLNKRQMRELQELEELDKQRAQAVEFASDGGEQSDEGEADEAPVGRAIQSAFGALNVGEAESEDEPSEEEVVQAKAKKSKKKKPKKKKAAAFADPSAQTDSPDPSSLPATPSAPSKSAKSRLDTPKAAADDGLDDIDRALAELAQKGGERVATVGSTGASAKLSPESAALRDTFGFDQKFLDPEAELRKMFGSKVIASAPAGPRNSGHLPARFANNPHHALSLRRTPSYLATPEPGWPSPAGVLALTRYDGPEAASDPSGEWWTYSHPVEYKVAQMGFLEVLQQADGNRLYNVLQGCPYHVDTHMQLAEMQTQQGDLGAASTHLSRALYALSAPLPPSFTSGSFRLPYSQIENRAFFLGIARRVAIMIKRGTWRTACEWAKIGLGAAGEADPVGMLCQLDFLAPKAKQTDWFLGMLENLNKAYPGMRIESYPGLAFAKALCLRLKENEKPEEDGEATKALRSAILRFPIVVTLLSNSLGSNLPPSFVKNPRAQPDGSFTTKPSYLLSLLSELYVVRSSPLWKEPPVFEWLNVTVRSVADLLDDSSLEDVRVGEKLFKDGPWPKGVAPAGVIRAAYIAEIPSVRPYLPPSAMQGTSYSYDPLPPHDDPTATFYDDGYFAALHSGAGGRRQRQRQQPPTAAARAQMNAMRQQLMRMLGMDNEGGAVELNEDLRRELMADLERLGAGGDGVPGGFPGMEEDEEDEGEEGEWEEEEGEQVDAEAQQGFLNRLLAFLPGAGAQPPAPEEAQ